MVLGHAGVLDRIDALLAQSSSPDVFFFNNDVFDRHPLPSDRASLGLHA
ncbi:MAG: hypothetical protein U0905_15200 [Pirellulales bacterium]